MKWVSYTRSISSRIGEENPSNTIAEQNERIARYLKKRGCSVSEKYSDRKRTAEATEGFDKLVQDGMARKFDAVVVDSIFRCGRTLPFAMCEEEKLVKDMMRGSNLDSARSIKMKENSILFRIQEAEERRLRLYEDYKAEILDEDEYSQLKEHYIAEKQRLEHELQKQRQRALELEKRIKICDAQMERMRGILNQNEFDEELVHELIKKIYVGMDNSVEVEFKCSDPYQEVLAIMSEVQNE